MGNIGCVILNYNDADNTIELVHQIKGYSCIDHIIVVDNSSTDDSVERLNAIKSEKVSIHISQRNGGYGYGNNYGIKIAKNVYECEYVIISNPDVRFSEETAASAIAFLKEHSNSAIAAPVQLRDGNTQFPLVAWKMPSPIHYLITSLAILGKVFPVKRYNLNLGGEAIKVDCIAGSFLCINVELFLSVAGYDENIFLNCEEVVLGLKLKARNLESYILTNCTYSHYHKSGSISRHCSNAIRSAKMLGKNRLYIVKTYMTSSKSILTLGKVIYDISMIETYIKWSFQLIKSSILEGKIHHAEK